MDNLNEAVFLINAAINAMAIRMADNFDASIGRRTNFHLHYCLSQIVT